MAQKDYYASLLGSSTEYAFAGIFSDDGISWAAVKKRGGFLQMMDACRAGKIDVIFTKSVSRFGRNTVDCLNAIRELKSLGVDVFFEKENIHTNHAEGELLLTLMMAIAEAESYSISDNVKWGLRKRVSQGRSLCLSTPPYGYRKVGEGLVVHETEAAVVQRIFQEVLDGYSCTEVARRLTADRVPTRSGAQSWAATVVCQMIGNEKYKGDFRYQKSFVADPLTKRTLTNHGELPSYYIEATHEPLVSKKIWECAQLEMRRRSAFYKEHHTLPSKTAEKDPLRAKVICSVCGMAYVKSSHSKYLHCSSRDRLRENKSFEGLTCLKARITREAPQEAFVRAWNLIVSRRSRYAAVLARIANGSDDMLRRYRAQEMLRLLEMGRKQNSFDYELSNKILDHIKVTPDGKLGVVFLAGTVAKV